MKYPSDELFEIIVIAFKVFKIVISDRYEGEFLCASNQRKALIKTINEFIDQDPIMDRICSKCGLPFKKLTGKCLFFFSNILLNNYSKSITDCVSKKKKDVNDNVKKSRKRKTDK